MTPRLGVASAAVGVLLLGLGQPGIAQVEVRTVIEDAEFVTGLTFLSDGTMVFNERAGTIRTADPNGRVGEDVAEIETVVEGETGLLGIAPAPDERSVYVFATEADGESNSVWRVGLDGGSTRRVITGMPASLYHNGGGVAFDEDGMLLISNGEEHDGAIAQDPAVLGGKVYRFTPEGAVPPDNPFGDSPGLAIGLRNPYGLAIDPRTGDAWVTENGPSSFDEVDRIVPGGNYGWPDVSGPAVDAPPGLVGRYQDPEVAYEETIVPTGIAFAGANANETVAGDLFVASYGEAAIHRLELNAARDSVLNDEIIHRTDEPIIALAWGPDGLYFSTPEAIHLLPVAAAGQDLSPDETAAAAEDPAPSPSPPPAAQDRRRTGLGALIAVAVPLLLLLGFLATRSRLDRASRDVPPPPG